MIKIKAIFIDVDNTLLDFDLCAKKAMIQCFGEVGLKYKEEYFSVFDEINSDLWRKIERGDITKAEMHEVRWQLIFEKSGIKSDGKKFDEIFCDRISDSCEKVEGAEEMLEYLSSKYKLYVASNGAEERQKKRLRVAGFYRYFSDIFASESIGVEKPDPNFLIRALRKIGNVCPEEAFFIGDSLTADIPCGNAVGMSTCWFDKYGTGDDKGVKSDFTIRSLVEIKNIL